MRGRKATISKKKIGMIVFGETNTGKSTTALDFSLLKREDGKPMRLMYIDCETGSVDMFFEKYARQGVDLGNIYVIDTQSLKELESVLDKVRNHEPLYEFDEDGYMTDQIVYDADNEVFHPDVIVVDGASVLHMAKSQALVEMSKMRNKVKADASELTGDARTVKIEGAGLELKDYNTLKFEGQNLILNLMSLDTHYIVTCRETDEKVQKIITDAKGQPNTVSVPTGRKTFDGFKGIDYNANIVWRMFLNEDDQVCARVIKDRTELHRKGEIIVDPSILEYQQVLNANKGKKDVVIKNSLNDSVQIEQELYIKEFESQPQTTTETKEVEQSKTVNNIDELKKSILQEQKKLDTTTKGLVKQKLMANNLPLTYAKITDEEVLQEVLKVIENVKQQG